MVFLKEGTFAYFWTFSAKKKLFCLGLSIFLCSQGENMRRVTQFQMAGWSQDGVCLNPPALMKLIDQLMIAQRRTGEGPVIVHGW